MHLRAVAYYVITPGVDQETARLTSDYPVLQERAGANKLKFDPTALNREVQEGKKGKDVGARIAATGNHGAVNYTIAGTGADNTKFKIDQKTGQITTDVDLDYDAEDTGTNLADNCRDADFCTVTVTATDASGEAVPTNATVTIKVTDVNEKPTFPSTALTRITVMENRTSLDNAATAGSPTPDELAAVTYTADDPEDRNITYNLLGPDAAKFELSSSQVLSFKAKPDYEAPTDVGRDNVYHVTVQASDRSLAEERMVIVTVTNEDDAPVVSGPSSKDFKENSTDPVATFTAEDPEGVTPITWGVLADDATFTDIEGVDAADAADADDFAIDKDGMLKFAIGEDDDPPDFENPMGSNADNTACDVTATPNPCTNTYRVVVTATEGTETGYHKVTVKVTNVAETGKVTWTVDPDGAADTTLAANTPPAKPILQFQTGATLVASATDGDIAGATKAVADTTTGVTNTAWRWYRGSTLISGQESDTYEVTTNDVGRTIRAEVTYTVGGGTTRETARLTSAYPVLRERAGANKLKFDPTALNREVQEGKKGKDVGARIAATGNHGAVNYTIDGTGADNAKFKIDQKTGQITTDVDLDYDAEDTDTNLADNCRDADFCTVTVTATDASGEAVPTNATVTIKVTDVNEKPTFVDSDTATEPQSPMRIEVAEGTTSLANASTPGNPTADELAAVTYAATDPEDLNVNLSLMGPDAAKFDLNNAGVLSFKAKPDYEMPTDANRDNKYQVTVRATDATRMHEDRMVTVTVTNADEAPVITSTVSGIFVSGQSSVNYAENGAGAVETYTARGENAANARWTLEGADAGDFSLSTSSGATTMLRFRSPPNFEAPADADTNNVYMVTVKATVGSESDTQDVSVTVTDVEETEDTLLEQHDANDNGKIDRDEVLDAIDDYFTPPVGSVITREQVLDLIDLYFDGLAS